VHTVPVKNKQAPLTGEALAEQIAHNERMAAFRALERMSPEYREWLEVLGDGAARARVLFAGCFEEWC
jgi:hypothetical protein